MIYRLKAYNDNDKGGCLIRQPLCYKFTNFTKIRFIVKEVLLCFKS